jgi:hypothetical protein
VKKICAAALLASLFGVSHAAVVTFDDLSPSTYQQLTNGYAGLNWGNVYAIKGDIYPATGYANGVVSGSNAAFNAYGYDATISATSSDGFDLYSAYFTAAVASSLTITANAVFEDGATASTTFTVNQTTPTYEVFDWSDVATVTFTAGNAYGDQFVVDNLTTTSPVPEPASLGLMLAGIGLAAAARRRKG